MKRTSLRDSLLPLTLLSLAVLYLAVLAAGVYESGMNIVTFMGALAAAMNTPLSLRWTEHTLKFMLIFIVAYVAGIALYWSSRENKRPGEEHGSAKWGDAREISRRYSDRNRDNNVILTKHMSMSLNGRKHMRNLLQIVVGGSGSGKTRYVVKPNIMQANASFICTDPKGELVRAVAPLLKERRYDVKVFDLIDPSRSDCFNPFEYIRSDSDVFRLINNFIQNTTPKDAQHGDPFWEKAETALDAALMLYLLHEAPPEDQTMEMILTMIEYGGAMEDSDNYKSALDLVFDTLEERNPEHIAVRQYHIFKQAAGKTAKSILVSAAVRLAAFTLPEIRRITARDEMELGKAGERKQAIFCVIPDSNDTSLNFIVGMLYTCAFQELYYQADKKHMGALPVPVRLMFDEFANVALPDGFARLQATMRSRNIMATVILQNISQLKALFKDDWEGIIGNADTLLYLDGNEQSTHKFISEQLGKETISARSTSQSRGRNGSFSLSSQLTGRELMTPDEVRMLDNRKAIVFIRGERPVVDDKYDLKKHPNLKYTEDGGAAPYIHTPTGLRQDLAPGKSGGRGKECEYDVIRLYKQQYSI